MILVSASALHIDGLAKGFNNLDMCLMDSSDIIDIPPRYLYAQLDKSIILFHSDGIPELLAIILALDRPVGNLTNRSRHEKITVYLQGAFGEASCEEGWKGCFSGGTGVIKTATCTDDSIPVIDTVKVVRKTGENVVW